MKTALQKHIDWLEKQHKETSAWATPIPFMQMAINNAKDLLAEDKKQIIEAYNQDLYGGATGYRKFEDGLDYYTQTFKK